jgi:hypothetical protein
MDWDHNMPSPAAQRPNLNHPTPSSGLLGNNVKRASSFTAADHRSKKSDSELKSQDGAGRALAAAERAQKAAQEAADMVAACNADRRIPDITMPSPVRHTSRSSQPLPSPPSTPLTESALEQHLRRTAPFSLRERVAPESARWPPGSLLNRSASAGNLSLTLSARS